MAAPKKKNPKSENLKLRVTPDFKNELNEIAEKKGLTTAALITLWLKERLENENKKFKGE